MVLTIKRQREGGMKGGSALILVGSGVGTGLGKHLADVQRESNLEYMAWKWASTSKEDERRNLAIAFLDHKFTPQQLDEMRQHLKNKALSALSDFSAMRGMAGLVKFAKLYGDLKPDEIPFHKLEEVSRHGLSQEFPLEHLKSQAADVDELEAALTALAQLEQIKLDEIPYQELMAVVSHGLSQALDMGAGAA